ncbi:hypothetical protein MNR02_09370 [Shinella sp. H4-D48]|uniref:hypothetical protein n=1 Tax=unclassified Shinella TaxID=2643062 RepID=UPI001F5318B5|nr:MULTISPECIES: hypothetical protein [unclassified Shinella]UNK36711.1 hypothetical protein MNR02_09370 [Shinella sp. H4-D48]
MTVRPERPADVGFVADPALRVDGVPPEYFLRLAFSQVYGGGTVSYHPAFYG